jgi:ribose 5-phosphate isomerase B
MKKLITIEGTLVQTGSHEEKIVVIGGDHRGFNYKQKIFEHLDKKGYLLADVGTFSDKRCDYPTISHAIGQKVFGDPLEIVGIGICGSGIGIQIPASKFRGVYAARCLTPEEAASSRKHNNTNMLTIAADSVSLETALATVDAWMETPFYSDPETEEPYLKRYVQTVQLEELALKK